MKRDAALRELNLLHARYPFTKLTRENVEAYLRALQPHNDEAIRRALERCAVRYPSFPALAQIFNELASGAGLPEPEVAWTLIACSGGVENSPPWPDLVRRIFRLAGGSHAFQNALDATSSQQEQFLAIYAASRANRIYELAEKGFGAPQAQVRLFLTPKPPSPVFAPEATFEEHRAVFLEVIGKLTDPATKEAEVAPRRERAAS